MLKLIIVDDEGRRTVVPFIRQEITIGRQEGNTIRLTERNVSRHHARLIRKNGAIVLEDLGSYNGVRVNGERVEGEAPIHDGDRVQIGDYQLALDDDSVQKPDRIPTRELEIAEGPVSIAVAPLRSGTTARVRGETPSIAAQPAEAALAERSAIAVKTERSSAKALPDHRPSIELDAKSAPRLVALNTDLAGREFACLRTDLKIGRSDGNDIVLDHPSLSRTHARLLRDGSGEWQVVDLESSNGMLVNGEAFGKARLRDGDLLEFGEVKLRFAAPVEGGDLPVQPGAVGSGIPLRRWVLAALVFLAMAGGAVYWLAANHRTPSMAMNVPTPTLAPAPEQEQSAAPIAPKIEPEQALPKPAKEAALAPPAQKPPAISASGSLPAQLAPKLRLANAAMTRRDFQKAVAILESIKRPDGSRPDEVDDPLYRASLELAAKKKLAMAQKSLSAGKLDETFRLLEESSSTVAFAKEHEKLKARAESARRSAFRKKSNEVKLVQAGKPAKPEVAAERPLPPPSEGALKLYDEGTNLYRKGKFTDAAGALTECLKVDPNFAKCHMVLGSTYAKLKEPELGAQHYRKFVQLAPSDPDAAKVKIFLEQYDSTRGAGK